MFEKWAQFTSEILEKESKLVREFRKHPTLIGDAREALVTGVLERFLPPLYEIGTGVIIDAKGGESKQIDIMVEGVLATIEVKSKLTGKSLTEALDNCYSVGALDPAFDYESMNALAANFARRTGLRLRVNENGELQQHITGEWRTPISPVTQAFRISGTPESYVFGFSGYKENEDDFREALAKWLESLYAASQNVNLRHMPTLVAAERCVALRNQYGAGIGARPQQWPLLLTRTQRNPLGLLVTRILYRISLVVAIPPNVDGLRPSMSPYLTFGTGQEEGTPLGWVRF